ncbi:Chromosome (plasmid) partitioning protein ParB [Vulgatibacter incomptus]|uniref:Chromosome (Plasmid) partitioning protein ParB n=1 Tax=Vulgatibacter incomptus TaxID=1391653 RepID=A0A0K1PH49_9BACT|nr:Chromosome (plasmid) partitioning protein ParB [Vulgatibacter incomptus]
MVNLAIEEIAPDKSQPRRRFEEAKIEELAASIRTKGVIQPILVRRDGDQYRIIAGERRWRASQRAGMKFVPALVKEVTERQAFELALIENIQREDLNAVEEAEAYRRLIDEHGLTQEGCAERVGKDRSSIANSLRLLRLPDDIKEALTEGELNMGHARALLGLADEAAMKRAAKEVASKSLSVRQTEQLVRKQKESGGESKAGEPVVKPDNTAQVRSVEERLQRALGTKVRLTDKGKGRGRLEIEFFSYEELDRLLAVMMGQ